MPSSSVIKILLDTVVDELGILRPSAYVGAQDIQGRQLLALFHQTGDYLVNQKAQPAGLDEGRRHGGSRGEQSGRAREHDQGGLIESKAGLQGAASLR